MNENEEKKNIFSLVIFPRVFFLVHVSQTHRLQLVLSCRILYHTLNFLTYYVEIGLYDTSAKYECVMINVYVMDVHVHMTYWNKSV